MRRARRGVEFDQTWTSAKGIKKDHQLFDLRTRDRLITSEAYTLGATAGEVWIKPAVEALGGTPPRFYMWTPFYFFGMPFKTFQGQEYDVTRVALAAPDGAKFQKRAEAVSAPLG